MRAGLVKDLFGNGGVEFARVVSTDFRIIGSWKELNDLGFDRSLRCDPEFLVDFFRSAIRLSPQYIVSGLMYGKRIGHTFAKHGSHNTKGLVYEAANSPIPQGQWLNDEAAEEFIARHLHQTITGVVDIPITGTSAEMICRMFRADERKISRATHIRLVPSGSGVRTAFPLNSNYTSTVRIGTFVE